MLEQEIIKLNQLEKFAFADLAAGTEKSSRSRGARQTVLIAARDWLDRWFVLESWAGRVSASNFQEKILELQMQYQPTRFGIEANGMQVLFGALVRDEARKRFIQASFVPIYQPKGVKKDYRIRTGLEPVISSGRLFIQDKVGPLAQELRGFPTAATVDLVDSLETLISRVAPKQHKRKVDQHQLDEFAKYLRATRCPPHLIESKMEEFKRKHNINLS